MNVRCCNVTRVFRAMKLPLLKLRIRTAFCPSRVTRLPPSMVVLTLMGRFMVAVIGMVTGAVPQLNVMTPPRVTAVFSALNVQLAGVPVPTTVVGLETSAGCAPAGSGPLQWVGITRPPPMPETPPVPATPPVPLAPPLPVVPPVPAPPPELLDQARSSRARACHDVCAVRTWPVTRTPRTAAALPVKVNVWLLAVALNG
jgi:hypothetical protein